MSEEAPTHFCEPSVDPIDGPEEWTCPACGRVWELREESGKDEDGDEWHDAWYQPRERCDSCERCTWNPGPNCVQADHPACPTCGHCRYRHVGEDGVAAP